MKNLNLIFILSLLLTSTSALAGDPVKTSEELRAKYPSIAEGSDRPENKKILCPFHRMLERAGLYDASKIKNPHVSSEILVPVATIRSAAHEFGCAKGTCGLVAVLASLGQTSTKGFADGTASPGKVNVTRLYAVKGQSHECGLTFSKDSTEVSDAVRTESLTRLKAIADKTPARTLTLEDLLAVKNEVCHAKGGDIEIRALYEYLGGNERGFVDYEDVNRILHAEMPLVKSTKYLNASVARKKKQ